MDMDCDSFSHMIDLKELGQVVISVVSPRARVASTYKYACDVNLIAMFRYSD